MCRIVSIQYRDFVQEDSKEAGTDGYSAQLDTDATELECLRYHWHRARGADIVPLGASRYVRQDLCERSAQNKTIPAALVDKYRSPMDATT